MNREELQDIYEDALLDIVDIEGPESLAGVIADLCAMLVANDVIDGDSMDDLMGIE